ncbi:hypothetical protein NX722_28500 [Endozoicomonas gorgoniicola]|uniref:Holliday junction resolvase n=1 Tax=Endozoicomonas gorgoniicola TaxID=1234144 RepID=A0ABT3N4E2_9GAMM|nr:hypothetical protein [Endozoicomonas gorgoniicola]MCW7556508.1 hypothetical protein [Endozoicomonas gorgoniicola]
MSINSRNKGAAGEREFCRELEVLTGIRLIRNLEQSRSGGYDLIPEDKAVQDSWPWALEIKRYASVSDAKVQGWLNQAVEQAESAGKQPVLAYRADRQDWNIVLPVGQWDILPESKGTEGYQWATVDIGLAAVILAGHFELKLKES